jgi:hypothetical protein
VRNGGRGKYTKYVSFTWPPLEAALPVLNFSFSVKNNFLEEIYKNKKDYNQCRNASCLKIFIIEEPFSSSIDRDVASNHRRIDMYRDDV